MRGPGLLCCERTLLRRRFGLSHFGVVNEVPHDVDSISAAICLLHSRCIGLAQRGLRQRAETERLSAGVGIAFTYLSEPAREAIQHFITRREPIYHAR